MAFFLFFEGIKKKPKKKEKVKKRKKQKKEQEKNWPNKRALTISVWPCKEAKRIAKLFWNDGSTWKKINKVKEEKEKHQKMNER